MQGLSVSIVRFIDAAQPGWVECAFADVHGKTWTIHEKVPIVTKAALTEKSSYPQPGVVACEILISWMDITGREVVTVNTATPHHVQAVTGETTFDVLASQLQSR